jgi:hypothetical protein
VDEVELVVDAGVVVDGDVDVGVGVEVVVAATLVGEAGAVSGLCVVVSDAWGCSCVVDGAVLSVGWSCLPCPRLPYADPGPASLLSGFSLLSGASVALVVSEPAWIGLPHRDDPAFGSAWWDRTYWP